MPASLPLWVPALFLGLVVLGYRQSLPHVVKPTKLVVIAAAMLGLSIYGVFSAFGADPLAFMAWATGYAAAVTIGAQRIGPRLAAADTKVRVPGSWTPLALMLGIFTAKFILGAATAMRAPVLHDAGFILAMSLALGALSGGFGARAVAVHRCASLRAAQA